jgi:galactose mutarotase-like enzyme
MTIVSIASDALSAQIDTHGAQLHALRDAQGRDLLWDGDPAVWTGRAPILFPIVGMLHEGRYRLDGATYAMAKHGFARHKTFEITETTPERVRLRLAQDAETLEAYPFDFALDLAFVLKGATLTMTATVGNPGPQSLPASFGFHPALRWPLPYGQPRQDHHLTFEQPEPEPIRRIDSRGLVTPVLHPTPVSGQELALRDDLFEDDALIFDGLASRSLRYGAGSGPSLEVAFPDTSLLGVWTKPGAGYVCIEPWHGVADPVGYAGDFRDKPGVFEVAPGGAKAISMSIRLAL